MAAGFAWNRACFREVAQLIPEFESVEENAGRVCGLLQVRVMERYFWRQISQTRCASSGTTSFSIARRTAPEEPGMQNIIVSR